MDISGLPGGMINTDPGGIQRTPGGAQAPARPGAEGTGIADGSIVDGLVTSQSGDAYTVRIGSRMLNAKSTIPLFVGQRFRAVWDASSQPPTLRLQTSDLAVAARFSGRDQQVAYALLSRGLPLTDDVMRSMRTNWLAAGGSPEKLGIIAELWARDLPLTDSNIALLSWYMGMSPEQASQIWRRIRDRIRRSGAASPKDLLEALRGGGDPDVERFMRAHAMAGKPARRGLDPAMLLAPAWWPVDDGDGESVMARVSLAYEEDGSVRVSWLNFEIEGEYLGLVRGSVMTNERALSISIRMKDESKISVVEGNLPVLRDDMSELSMPLQHIGVSPIQDETRQDRSRTRGLDMEV